MLLCGAARPGFSLAKAKANAFAFAFQGYESIGRILDTTSSTTTTQKYPWSHPDTARSKISLSLARMVPSCECPILNALSQLQYETGAW